MGDDMNGKNWVNFHLHWMATSGNICKSLKGVTFWLTLYTGDQAPRSRSVQTIWPTNL